MLMSGLVRKSVFHPYHSLTAEVKVAGRRAVAAWVLFSTLKMAEVGPQVLVLKDPQPRNWL